MNNFSDDIINKNPLLVNLKLSVLWGMGFLVEWKKYETIINEIYVDKVLSKEDPELE